MRRSRISRALEGGLVQLGDGTLVRLGQSVYPDQPGGPWRHGAEGGGLPSPPDLRAPFEVNLVRSGERGAPLTAGRRLYVLPVPNGGGPMAQPAPAVDLTRAWPWLFPPEDNWPIARASAPVSILAGATLTIPFITAGGLAGIDEVPRGYRGIIKKFGQTANDFTVLTWNFRVKGRPTNPIVNIAFQFGALNDPTDLTGAVFLNPGDDFVVTVQNTGGAVVANVAARVDFYLWRM